MGNAGVHEFAAAHRESGPAIEPNGVRLCIQDHLPIAARCGDLDQAAKNRLPHPSTPIAAQYGHAPDVPVGQQASRADGLADRIQREDMATSRVGIVPFEFLRHLLFNHEHRATNGAETLGSIVPRDFLDPTFERRVHDADYNSALSRDGAT